MGFHVLFLNVDFVFTLISKVIRFNCVLQLFCNGDRWCLHLWRGHQTEATLALTEFGLYPLRHSLKVQFSKWECSVSLSCVDKAELIFWKWHGLPFLPPQWVDFLWAPWAHTPGRPIKDSYNLDLPWAHLTALLEGPSSSSSPCFLSPQVVFPFPAGSWPQVPHSHPLVSTPDGLPEVPLFLPEVPASLTAGSAEWLSLCFRCMMARSVMGVKDHSVHWMKLWGWRETLPLVLAKGH